METWKWRKKLEGKKAINGESEPEIRFFSFSEKFNLAGKFKPTRMKECVSERENVRQKKIEREQNGIQ